MSEWNIQALEGGGHRVLHHDHDTGEWSDAGIFPPVMTIGDVLGFINDYAADGDYVLLPDGSPVVLLDLPPGVPKR
jgi:hypothetical protein